METNPSSSSSSSPPAKKFDVFLSFRGEDTRNNFTGHLSLALRKIGLFNIFKDDYALEKGKDIWPEFKNSIKDSQYAVVVLSENYATSSWCLRELAKIVKCAGNDSLKIRTIFYHVNPSDVRNVKSTDERKQKGSFWEAMKAYQQNPSYSEKTLEEWRNALVTVANQSGYPIEAHTDEAIFIKEFVAKISHELGASIRTIDGLIGMTSRLHQLDSYVLQSTTTNNVCFLGIHGMGGLGKSTLARAYYKRVSHKFDGGCFLQNVREVSEKEANGLVTLQKKLLTNILKGYFAEIGHVEDGIDMIRSRFRRKKLLIVLDDVSKEEELTALADEDNWFGSGSVIIVTTREDSFLTIRKYAIHRAEYLNPSDALQLFSWKAFRSVKPPKEYEKLSEQVIKYASYLPLALTVLGSLLGRKSTSEWESALQRLTKCPEKEIVEKLKISFDDLNETDQCIFLDIACFFNGDHKDKVIEILDSCDSYPIIGIRNLINKSLLSIQNDGTVWMHDLLVEMGKGIVRKESGNNLGRQSRIWDANDLYRVLENEEGTNKVEAIKAIKVLGFKFDAFSSMKNLRLLMIRGCRTRRVEPKLKYLSNNLQYLDWNKFHYKRLPSSFQPLELVQLSLTDSKIQQLWNNCVKPLYKLKVIDLSYSKYLTKFEDFQVVPNLEKLILYCCPFLSEIHPSIKHLKKLINLDLGCCTRLEKLPEEINGLASLQILNLYRCNNLEKLPDNLAQLTSLRELKISRIKHLPSSINLMEMLVSLNCDISKTIQSDIQEDIMSYGTTTGKCVLPAWFSTEPESRYLMSVTSLNLSDGKFSGPEAFPEYFSNLVSLEKLRLDRNPFAVLPVGIKGFTNLTSLNLEHCESLRCLEAELLPSSLQLVNVNFCTSLASFLDPSKPCHFRCSYVSCVDCTELVKRQDAKMTALGSLSRFLDDQDFSKRRDYDLGFEFVIPQGDNELPSWFINQSSTGSINIKFDPNRRNSELIGLALVFCFPGDSDLHPFVCNIRVDGGEKGKIKLNLDELIIFRARCDHLFLLCYPIRDAVFSNWDGIAGLGNMLEPAIWETLEFSFSCHHHELCTRKRCKKDSSCGSWAWAGGMCGARLVYKEDIEELKQITTQYIHRDGSEAFKSSAQLGVGLNVTKASTLPTACKVSAPSLSNCELSTALAGAPALSPGSTPTTTAVAPEQGAGANEQAPAPAPGSSSSSMLFATVGSLLIALVIAYSSWF